MIQWNSVDLTAQAFGYLKSTLCFVTHRCVGKRHLWSPSSVLVYLRMQCD